MKIIIDANCGHLLHTGNEDGLPILKKLLQGKLLLCMSKEMTAELSQTRVADIYRDLMLSGLIRNSDEATIETEKVAIVGKCKSNDAHVIALARESGCRLLFSKDKPLHCDFTNPKLIPKPKGKVYQNKKHMRLLPA